MCCGVGGWEGEWVVSTNRLLLMLQNDDEGR